MISLTNRLSNVTNNVPSYHKQCTKILHKNPKLPFSSIYFYKIMLNMLCMLNNNAEHVNITGETLGRPIHQIIKNNWMPSLFSLFGSEYTDQ